MRAITEDNIPFVIWLTGLSGSGKSTVARHLKEALKKERRPVYQLDGDVLRAGLCSDLGFSRKDRAENNRRMREVAKILFDAGVVVVVSAISPFREDRARNRAAFPPGRYVEVFVDTPLEICEARDVKGLYAKARAGLIREFTGIDSPYEPPERPELHLDGARLSMQEMTARVLDFLRERGLLEGRTAFAERD